jgi:PPOX class probable FMN-dependent enzyme
MWDDEKIESVAQLRTMYREPSEVAGKKDRAQLDAASRQFIERSRFMLLGTHDTAGGGDVSPRGGPSGFVLTLDDHHLAIADLGGNNRLDSMRNIVETGKVGLLFIVPGQGETVRVNGDAWITTSAKVLDRFELPRRPKAAVVVRVETTFVHCAKAFLRSGIWDPEVWAELADTPDGAQILVCQGAVTMDDLGSRERLNEAYEHELSRERTPAS